MIIVRSIGKSLPEKKVLNNDLPKELDTNDEWIRSHTGIGSRYLCNKDEVCSSLALGACSEALKKAGVSAEEIDLIICTTTTPDYNNFPSTACIIQNKLGAVNATCFDLCAACTGFLYGLNSASGMLLNNGWKYALVVGSEILSKITDWSDRSTCILFGDGAGAFVIENREEEKERGIGSFVSGSDGSGGMALYVSPDDGFMKMDGHAVYNFAVKVMTEAIEKVMKKENLGEADVDYFVCHQANERIIQAAAKRLGFNMEKFICCMGEYGNTSSASIPIALYDMQKEGKIKDGTVIVSAAFGAGLTWAGTVFRF